MCWAVTVEHPCTHQSAIDYTCQPFRHTGLCPEPNLKPYEYDDLACTHCREHSVHWRQEIGTLHFARDKYHPPSPATLRARQRKRTISSSPTPPPSTHRMSTRGRARKRSASPSFDDDDSEKENEFDKSAGVISAKERRAVTAMLRHCGKHEWADDLEEYERRVRAGTMERDAGDRLRQNFRESEDGQGKEEATAAAFGLRKADVRAVWCAMAVGVLRAEEEREERRARGLGSIGNDVGWEEGGEENGGEGGMVGVEGEGSIDVEPESENSEAGSEEGEVVESKNKGKGRARKEVDDDGDTDMDEDVSPLDNDGAFDYCGGWAATLSTERFKDRCIRKWRKDVNHEELTLEQDLHPTAPLRCPQQ